MGDAMMGRAILAYVIVPVVLFAGYFVCLELWPAAIRALLHSEHGLIEQGTAVSFLVAAGIGARLTQRTRARGPRYAWICYLVFSSAGLFVALEEISYGQHLFHWESPRWFLKHNSKAETNLHNLFRSKPSNRLRAMATIGCPVFCIALPLAALARGQRYNRAHWEYYLLPRSELLTLSALTVVLTVFNKIPSIKGMASWSGHLGELKELCWGVTAACYAGILYARASGSQMDSSSLQPPPGGAIISSIRQAA
jgi:hypothetical protein